MNIYRQFQPVTWDIGIIDASPEDVVRNIQPLYIPDDKLEGIYQKKKTIEEGLVSLEPIGGATKFLLVETVDGRTVLFNSIFSFVELPTWYAMNQLGAESYYICNVPNTISKDQRSGAWGARKLEFRTIKTPYNKEPAFGIQVVNDCGRWHFYRFGDKLPFEDEMAYRRIRKTERFTQEMLVRYCSELGIPVYDKNWYSDKWILIQGKAKTNEKGMTYQEAAIRFRINQDAI